MLAAGKGQPARRRLRQERRRDNLLTLYHLGQGHGGALLCCALLLTLSHMRSNLNASVPALSPWNTSVGGSRPRSPAYAGTGTGGPQGACQSPSSVRAQRSAPTAAVACYVPRVRGSTSLALVARQPYRRARRPGSVNAVSPPQFSPFGNPLSVIPPLIGTRQRGQTAGGNSTASLPARLKKPRGPSPPAEPRPAALRVDGTGPPLGPHCAVAPRGRARWSGRRAFVPHTSPAVRGVRKLTQFQRLRLAPRAPAAPGHDLFSRLFYSQL